MHFTVVVMQLLGGRRKDQLLEMGSEIKVTNGTFLQHLAPGTASGVEVGWGSTPAKP